MIHIPEFIKYFQQQSEPRGVVCYTREDPWSRHRALPGSPSTGLAALRMPVAPSLCRPCLSHHPTLQGSPGALTCSWSQSCVPEKGTGDTPQPSAPNCPWLGIPELPQELLSWASPKNRICDSLLPTSKDSPPCTLPSQAVTERGALSLAAGHSSAWGLGAFLGSFLGSFLGRGASLEGSVGRQPPHRGGFQLSG